MQTRENPMGTDGFAFLEFAGPDVAALAEKFEKLGFTAVARHKNKNITLYQQGNIRFLSTTNLVRTQKCFQKPTVLRFLLWAFGSETQSKACKKL